MFAVVVQRTGMFRIEPVFVAHPDQFFHDIEHVDLAFVKKHFCILYIRFFYNYIAIVNMIDAVTAAEIAANFYRVFSHFAGHPAVERDPVGGAVYDTDKPFPMLKRFDDLLRPVADRYRWIIWMERHPYP